MPLKVTSRASWIEIKPASSSPMVVGGPWRHALPAAFDLGPDGKTHISISGPREVESGKDAVLEITIDNRSGAQPFDGIFQSGNSRSPLQAQAGEKTSRTFPIATTGHRNALISSYLIEDHSAILGRGDFTVVLQADLTKPPDSP